MPLHIIGRSKVFDLFPRTDKGKNWCISRKKHALINSRERPQKSDINLEQSSHVETVCLLSKLNVEHHIEVDVNLDEMDLTKAESKATYEEIKGYVKENMGLHVSNLYIAQVKRKCGIIERENYNKAKTESFKQPQCPLEKEEAIMAALKYFRMV